MNHILALMAMYREMKEVYKMSLKSKFRFFKEDIRDRCGICFERCPVLELPDDEAKQEIKRSFKGIQMSPLGFSDVSRAMLVTLSGPGMRILMDLFWSAITKQAEHTASLTWPSLFFLMSPRTYGPLPGC